MSTAKIKAIVLYCEQLSLIRSYTFEQLGHLLSALIRNADGEDAQAIESSLQEPVLTAYRFIALQINIDKEKYQQTCERRRAAINKRWAKNKDDTIVDFVIHNNNKNNNKNKNENKNNNKNENKNNSSCAAVDISEPVANAEEAAAAAASFNMEEAKEYCLKNVLPWFNGILDNADSKIPRIQDFNDQRTERYVAAHKKYGIKKIEKAFRNAARSPFLNGNGKRNTFVASFDWILDEEHFLKVCEGEYNTHR
jgi:hypothetical protein